MNAEQQAWLGRFVMRDNNEYLENNHGVHIGHPEMDTTLCGDAIEGDEPDLSPCKTVKAQPLTCETCLKMIERCQRVPGKFA